MPAAPRCRYSPKCPSEYIDSPTATGMDVAAASRSWPATSSAGSGSSNQAMSWGSSRAARRIASAAVIDWFASTMIGMESPTASRAAAIRRASSAAFGRPILILMPCRPLACDARAEATSSSSLSCSQPPSVS